jgi:hypothetical protein
MYQALQKKTIGQCVDVMMESSGNISEYFREYSKFYNWGKTPCQRFGIQKPSDSLDRIIESLALFYNQNFNPFAAAEFLFAAKDGGSDALIIPPEKALPNILSYKNAEMGYAYYSTNALGLFNKILPDLQSGNFNDFETLLKIQQSIEFANAALIHGSMLKKYEQYIAPEKRIKNASKGGKARAQKLYGRTKIYTAKRFAEIRAKNSKLPLSQIAKKIEDELAQKPIQGDEPLTNPYDTIYRWVRGLGKAN